MKKPLPREDHERWRVMRISHASLTPALRERERAFARLYPEVDMSVVTTTRWREAEVDVEAVDDDLFPVTKVRPRFSNHIQLFAYESKPIIAALRHHRPHLIDLNHEPYSVACAEILTLCSRYAPQAQIVLQTNQNIFRNYLPPFNLFERRALKRAAAAYVCSESVREVLCAKGFTRPIAAIPFGVDTQEFRFRPRLHRDPSEPPTIGFIGRMLPGKGLSTLAGALALLAQENWNVLLVGDGPERADFEREMAARDLLSRARFTGAIPYDQVPPLFQEMDLLVVPTQTTKRIREQFGRVLIEAMASGVPVIGSTCGAIPEVIGNAGLIFQEGDCAALAGAIKEMLADATLRRRLANEGRARVEANYSWNVVAEKTFRLFNHVLREAPAVAGARLPQVAFEQS
jgi:glycosyltransferase involved in cell wall biosynthesis